MFEFFVHWLYHKRLSNEDDAPDLYNAWADEDDNGDSETDNLIRLYVLGEKCEVPALQLCALNSLFTHMVDTSYALVNDAQIAYAFDNLSNDSPVCKLLADLYCEYADSSLWKGITTCEYPQEFLEMVLCRYTKYTVGGRMRGHGLLLCDYHDHKQSAERTACEAKRGGKYS